MENKEKALELIRYGIFGMLTTILNIQVHFVLYSKCGVDVGIQNIIAWAVGVVFAFITNKLFVFNSKSLEFKHLFRELWTFTTARLATGVMDEIIVVAGAAVLSGSQYETMGNLAVKVASNVLVIILNYIFSKLIVFKNNGKDVKHEENKQ